MSANSKTSIEVPEAWDLARIRQAVQAIADGVDVAETIGVQSRQAGYHLQSARVLSWLERVGSSHSLTSSGAKLLTLKAGSQDERAFIRHSIANTTLVRSVLPELLEAMSHQDIRRALINHPLTKLSKTTAQKRANALVKWRQQISRSDAASTIMSPMQRKPALHAKTGRRALRELLSRKNRNRR